MTKYRKKVPKHVEQEWTESKTLCDFCHRDVESVNEGHNTEIDLEAKIGTDWGTDGDARDAYRIDCCEKCFLNKVKPAIEALGVKWHEYNPEDAWVRSSYGSYWADDIPRMDGKLPSEIEESGV